MCSKEFDIPVLLSVSAYVRVCSISLSFDVCVSVVCMEISIPHQKYGVVFMRAIQIPNVFYIQN